MRRVAAPATARGGTKCGLTRRAKHSLPSRTGVPSVAFVVPVFAARTVSLVCPEKPALSSSKEPALSLSKGHCLLTGASPEGSEAFVVTGGAPLFCV